MSQADEQGAAPQQRAYRAPTATAVGAVEELTAGGGGRDYADAGGTYMVKPSRVEAPASDEE